MDEMLAELDFLRDQVKTLETENSILRDGE